MYLSHEMVVAGLRRPQLVCVGITCVRAASKGAYEKVFTSFGIQGVHKDVRKWDLAVS